MKLHEEFKLYETMWNDLPANRLTEAIDVKELSNFLQELGFQGTALGNSYASLHSDSVHRLYVCLGDGSTQDIKFSIDRASLDISYQDLSTLLDGNLIRPDQTGFKLLVEQFLKLAKSAPFSDFTNDKLEALILLLACCSDGGKALYKLFVEKKLDTYLEQQAANITALIENALKETNEALQVRPLENCCFLQTSNKDFLFEFFITIKIINSVENKKWSFDFKLPIGNFKNLRTILFGFSTDKATKQAFYRTHLETIVSDILYIYGNKKHFKQNSSETESPNPPKNETTSSTEPESTSEKPASTEAANSTEPKNAKLNRARQANLKIIKAFKEIGLATDDLTVTAKNKNGKDYRKASDKLNKLRKTLFGESFDADEEIEIED